MSFLPRMKRETSGLFWRWLVGLLGGTALVAITSPIFVRGYVPREQNRGVVTMAAGSQMRWRVEGYATTHFGPLGMAGKTSVSEPSPDSQRIALWGDSQGEGFCVNDPDKIFAQIERSGQGKLDVFPLARSGDEAAHWLMQMESVETELQIGSHIILITDLKDLLSAGGPPSTLKKVKPRSNQLARWLPAFLNHGFKNLLTSSDGSGREVRFNIGPVNRSVASQTTESALLTYEWPKCMQAISDTTKRPVLLVYAPNLPRIVDGRMLWDDAHQDDFVKMRQAAEEAGFSVIDLRTGLRELAESGQMPNGFDNGLVGSGHFNRHGNALIGRRISETLLSLEQQETP
ncbi:MAG: hypothetical protein AB8B91_08115 [Rubripirellula sp.]